MAHLHIRDAYNERGSENEAIALGHIYINAPTDNKLKQSGQ